MLFDINFDDIDITIIRSLINNAQPEDIYLEFKRDRYGKSDKDKKEMLKDISAFANTFGGHIIIGIAEDNDGRASKIVPLSDGIDKELQRMEEITNKLIQPTIIDLRMKRIEFNGGGIIVVRIPPSSNPPHCITFGSNRYYGRHSSGVRELSRDQLCALVKKQTEIKTQVHESHVDERELLGNPLSSKEQAESFVLERIKCIQNGDGIMPLPISDGVLVIHLVPLPDFKRRQVIENSKFHELPKLFQPISYGESYAYKVNASDFCAYCSGGYYHGYTKIFPDGTIEATSANAFLPYTGYGLMIPSEVWAQNFINNLSKYMKGLYSLNASPPMLLQISAIVASGEKILLYAPRSTPYSREVLLLPSTTIVDYRDDGYHPIIAEQMHFLWKAFGADRCPFFDNAGNWIGGSTFKPRPK